MWTEECEYEYVARNVEVVQWRCYRIRLLSIPKLEMEGDRMGSEMNKKGKDEKWHRSVGNGIELEGWEMGLHGIGAPPPRVPHDGRLSGANHARWLPLASTLGWVIGLALKISLTNSQCSNSLSCHLQLPVSQFQSECLMLQKEGSQ